ncbi:hypothetical protein GmHk_06G018015 [Glycine max]|nr:hypothetical protein GmHk_06G018015 [Glycine max]
MSHFHASSLHWTNLNEELEQLLANVPKLTIEEHGEWRELANMMQNVVAPPEAFFWTVHARDQIFGEVGKVYTVKWNDVLDGDVPSSIYYFLKDKGWTHLHLEDVVECRLVFNYYRKTLKIGARWKHFCETLSLTADMEIVFEFIDLNINRVLYWSCL